MNYEKAILTGECGFASRFFKDSEFVHNVNFTKKILSADEATLTLWVC